MIEFIQMKANYQSQGWCGHLILKGDGIGYDRKKRRAICQDCFERVKLKELARKEQEIQEAMKLS